MRPAIFLVEFPPLTARQIVLKSYLTPMPCDEPTIQYATLCVEIIRAEKAYEISLKGSKS